VKDTKHVVLPAERSSHRRFGFVNKNFFLKSMKIISLVKLIAEFRYICFSQSSEFPPSIIPLKYPSV
jgi:hypothetical protein